MSFPFPISPKPNINDFGVEDDSLGVGNFSVVRKALYKRSGNHVAIKEVSKSHVVTIGKELDLVMEKHALMRLHHPNIIRLLATFSDHSNLYIVTEFCAGGELWELCKFVGEPENRAKVWFKQLIEAVSYMHRMGIVHRDLKAENVLLSADLCTVKICDFGSARDVFNPHIRGASTVSNRKSFQHYVGTPNFLSPEAITNTENDFVSDIWSLGCLFYQVLCGIPPFVAGSEYLVYIRIRAADLQIPPRGLSQEAESLIKSIVRNDRNSRPSLYEISNHEFFLNTPGDQLPDYNSDDNRVRKIIRSRSDDIIPEQLLGQSTYFEDRLDLAHTVKRWRDSSAPGTGLGTVEHLMDRVPELAGLKNFIQSTDTLDSIQTIS